MQQKGTFKLGVTTYFQSFGFILRNRLAHFFIYPIIIAILMVTVFAFGLYQLVDDISEVIFSWFGIEDSIEGDFWEWENIRLILAEFAQYAVLVLIYIAVIYLYFKLQKYIVLVLMAPLMALLSERVDEILTGREFPFSWSQLMKDIWRGILISVRNFAMEMLIVAVVWLVNIGVSFFFSPLSFIFTPVTFVLLLVVSSYYYGFSSIDFNNERYRLKVGQSVQYVRNHKGMSVGNGLFFHLWMYIPFLGVVIAPVTCTVGAALAVHKTGGLNTERTDFVEKI